MVYKTLEAVVYTHTYKQVYQQRQNLLCKIWRFRIGFNIISTEPFYWQHSVNKSSPDRLWHVLDALWWAWACSAIILLHVNRVQFIEKPLTLSHEDFDGLCDQDIWRQDASRLHSNCMRKRLINWYTVQLNTNSCMDIHLKYSYYTTRDFSRKIKSHMKTLLISSHLALWAGVEIETNSL